MINKLIKLWISTLCSSSPIHRKLHQLVCLLLYCFYFLLEKAEETIAEDRSVAVQALMPGGAGYNGDTKQPETGAVYFDISLCVFLYLCLQ